MTIKHAQKDGSDRASESSESHQLLELRIIVGYLGEESQFGWWKSSFFSETSASFLTPVFPRTLFLAQAEGVRASACKLHDERIGVGKVFHLFRLPEELEQSFHRRLHNAETCNSIGQHISSKETAMEFLENHFGGDAEGAIGPVSVGDVRQASNSETMKAIGQQYLHGFTASTPVFPFLKEG